MGSPRTTKGYVVLTIEKVVFDLLALSRFGTQPALTSVLGIERHRFKSFMLLQYRASPFPNVKGIVSVSILRINYLWQLGSMILVSELSTSKSRYRYYSR
jgi:hypothetical protein